MNEKEKKTRLLNNSKDKQGKEMYVNHFELEVNQYICRRHQAYYR